MCCTGSHFRCTWSFEGNFWRSYALRHNSLDASSSCSFVKTGKDVLLWFLFSPVGLSRCAFQQGLGTLVLFLAQLICFSQVAVLSLATSMRDPSFDNRNLKTVLWATRRRPSLANFSSQCRHTTAQSLRMLSALIKSRKPVVHPRQ